MNRDRFEQLVAKAVETLPDEFLERLDNIVVVVEDYPTSEQLAKSGVKNGNTLLGLYEGVPLTSRSRYDSLMSPDYITVFKKPIESKCGGDDAEITAEIQKVVQHEIAHHFGIGDARLKQIEKAKLKRKRKAV